MRHLRSGQILDFYGRIGILGLLRLCGRCVHCHLGLLCLYHMCFGLLHEQHGFNNMHKLCCGKLHGHFGWHCMHQLCSEHLLRCWRQGMHGLLCGQACRFDGIKRLRHGLCGRPVCFSRRFLLKLRRGYIHCLNLRFLLHPVCGGHSRGHHGTQRMYGVCCRHLLTRLGKCMHSMQRGPIHGDHRFHRLHHVRGRILRSFLFCGGSFVLLDLCRRHLLLRGRLRMFCVCCRYLCGCRGHEHLHQLSGGLLPDDLDGNCCLLERMRSRNLLKCRSCFMYKLRSGNLLGRDRIQLLQLFIWNLYGPFRHGYFLR